ncbi:MAG: DUF489 family protein [Succinivibrio sp.]|nr:DUF489 family protein [Succinivibrio sp.]
MNDQNKSPIKNEAIALAAATQSCQQIARIANTGYCDEHAAAVVIKALLVTDPKTVEDIYAPSDLASGFRMLSDSLSNVPEGRSAQTIEVARMLFKVISLEQTIEHNSQLFNKLGSDIDELKLKVLRETPDYLSSGDDVILREDYLREYAALYQSLVSRNFAKLIIYGSELYLGNPSNQNRIRALLLAAIRAAVLWRQCGGRRRYLIFRRNALAQYARSQILSNYA